MLNPRRKIEFHMIKNYPYSNLNRDEFGTPKNYMFGGYPHGRISSQSLKRSWREYFKENFDNENFSIRTRALPDEVRKALEEAGKDEKFIALANKVVKDMFVTENEGKKKRKEEAKDPDELKKKEFMTGQVVPFSPAEVNFFKEEFSKVTQETLEDDKKRKAFIKDFKQRFADLGTALDIALWGRMVTSSVVHSTEAAMQVAHATSTHPIAIEQDIFTAVDDIIKDGAGMYGVAEYDSCCYYEYGCLDYDLLVENLGGDEERAKKAVPMLIQAIAFSNPSGKNTSTGTNIMPSAMIIEKKAVPYNLVNAFCKPMTQISDKGIIFDSADKLAHECDVMFSKFGIESTRYWFSTEDIECQSAETTSSINELIEKASALV